VEFVGVVSAAYCILLLPPVFSEFVFVLVVVQVFFFHDVQLYRIESNYFKVGTAFLTGNAFAFISVRIHMDISITLGTCSSRHFLTSKESLLRQRYIQPTRRPCLRF
jgi:hypothetical protein